MFDVADSRHVSTLRSRLSVERLASYDAAMRGCPVASLSLYEWNTAAGAALFASLQGFETNTICPVTRAWIERTSTLGRVIGQRPS